jgi:hypothetical protein
VESQFDLGELGARQVATVESAWLCLFQLVSVCASTESVPACSRVCFCMEELGARQVATVESAWLYLFQFVHVFAAAWREVVSIAFG